VTSW
jgi:hypothetical protein